MSCLAVLLIAVGVTDLVRSHDPAHPREAYAVGPVVVVVLAALARLRSWQELTLLAVAAVTTVGWTWLSARAVRTGTRPRAALSALAGGIAIQLLCTAAVGAPGGPLASWLSSSAFATLHGATADRFLLVTGLFAVQLTTGNLIVRLVLTAIGSIRPEGQPQPSDRLRGGRLLGPMERVFILGLGLAGAPTAAALVIAAKGLIRFPELNTRRTANVQVKGVGIDEVTEYFLVGSFVSWLVAMAALGLAFLA